MKNKDVLELASAGFADITAYTLGSAEAFRVFRLRKAIHAVWRKLFLVEMDMQRECGIEDSRRFDAELMKLRQAGDSEELTQMEGRLLRYLGMRNAMYEEPCELPAITPLGYDDWRKLQAENKESKALSGENEMLLEGVLWVAPQEEEKT